MFEEDDGVQHACTTQNVLSLCKPNENGDVSTLFNDAIAIA